MDNVGTDSEQLLNEYASHRSEAAFAEIVERHVDLVYGTARRIGNGDAHFAADVTQVVFRDLAAKSTQVARQGFVAGWLYRHCCFVAWKLIRTDQRRQKREQAAMELTENNPNDSSIDPADLHRFLDQAMA